MCGFVGAFDLNSGSQPLAQGLKEELRSQVLEMSKKYVTVVRTGVVFTLVKMQF